MILIVSIMVSESNLLLSSCFYWAARIIARLKASGSIPAVTIHLSTRNFCSSIAFGHRIEVIVNLFFKQGELVRC
jgi:hypothetical protein